MTETASGRAPRRSPLFSSAYTLIVLGALVLPPWVLYWSGLRVRTEACLALAASVAALVIGWRGRWYLVPAVGLLAAVPAGLNWLSADIHRYPGLPESPLVLAVVYPDTPDRFEISDPGTLDLLERQLIRGHFDRGPAKPSLSAELELRFESGQVLTTWSYFWSGSFKLSSGRGGWSFRTAAFLSNEDLELFHEKLFPIFRREHVPVPVPTPGPR